MVKLIKPKLDIKIIFAILVGLLLFSRTKKPIVNALFSEDQKSFSQLESIKVLTEENDDGFSQIVVMGDENLIIKTNENFTHANPGIDNETTITWMSQIDAKWQIFIQNVQTSQPIQLTFSNNNVNPQIYGGKVAWEGQLDGVWQIFLFDGVRVSQISQGSSAKKLSGIEGDYVIYQQKVENDKGWQLYLYDNDRKQTRNLTPDTIIGNSNIDGSFVTWYSTDENGATIFYIHNIETNITGSEIIPEAKITKSSRSLNTSYIKKVKENTPSIIEKPKIVEEKDIQKELGLDQDIEVKINEDAVVETPESTDSNPAPLLEDALDLQTEESTQSEN